VAHARDYPWSSYRAHAEGAADGLVTDHRLYQRLGKTAEERQAAYRQLFKSHLGEVAMEQIREATNKAWVLGGERFKNKMETLAQRRVRPLSKGRPRMED
jgi:putative transposase